MNSSIETVRSLVNRAVEAVDVDALVGMPARDLIVLTAEIERLGRVVDAQRVASATAIERRSDRWLGTAGLAQSYGYRRGVELVEQVTGVSVTTARRRMRLGGAVGQRDGSLGVVLPPLFPVVGAALAAGRIGVDAARAITEELGQTGARADAAAVRVAERLLVAQAAGRPEDVADVTAEGVSAAGLPERDVTAVETAPGPVPADLIGLQARVWRDALDPDGVEPRTDVARSRRCVSLSRVPVGGLHTLRGRLTPDVAAAVMAYFDSLIVHAGVSFRSDEALTMETPCECRGFDQQRHDLFAALVRAAGTAIGASDSGLPTPAPLIIHIDSDQLERRSGTGSISGVSGPVAWSYLTQIACDGGIQLLASRHGRIVRLGTKTRFFTAGQRRAVAVRDGNTCVVPGCSVPYAALEAHHVEQHSRGGPTMVDNCVLLCWWHHHMIDSEIWTVTMVGGRPRIRVPVRANLRLAA